MLFLPFALFPFFLWECSSADEKLIFAHVIYRHGDRNVDKTFPNDPFANESIHWPGGFGALTNKGKNQLYDLGKYFRRRYANLIGSKYSSNEIYVRATDYDRTIMSAQVNLAGIFPPHDDEIWNENVMWQPIPVHTIPTKFDYELYGPTNCPKFFKAYEKYENESPEAQRIYTEYSELFVYWSRMSGLKIQKIDEVSSLYSTLQIERLHNKTLPNWAAKAIEPNGIMENIRIFHFKMAADTKELARLQSGFLIREIFERFGQKINATLRPDRSLWLYSAHDLTILCILNSLGLFDYHLPSYAASLHFELYETEAKEHYIRLFYRRSIESNLSPLIIPNCGLKCSLTRLYELYKDIIPGDHDSECAL